MKVSVLQRRSVGHIFSKMLVILCLSLLVFPVIFKYVEGAEIINLTVTREKNSIVVNTHLALDESQINDLKNGIQKEFEFYVDLFKVWDFWPDEFVSGIKIIRTIKSDPVKKEFSMVSYYETSIKEERFNSLDTLLLDALRLEEMDAFSTKGLLPGEYFVKVSVISRIRKLAPIIGYLLFFVPEKEFSIKKNSERFLVLQDEE